MKVAIITDQHFGFKKGSKLYHDYFLKFYEETFFPTLEREGITTILDLGDTFDNRKGIDSYSLDWRRNIISILFALAPLMWLVLSEIILLSTKTLTNSIRLIYYYESTIILPYFLNVKN